MAKFNIEVELDWIDEETGCTIDEEIKEQVVSGVMMLGKVRITPFRVLTCLLFFASLIMTLATAIWFLFFYLK